MKNIIKKRIKSQGFTLIELLVVIAIIGVLVTLAVISLQGARRNARDAKRISDIRQIQTALELYYNNNNNYPSAASIYNNNSILDDYNVYMPIFPTAPNPPDGDCQIEDNNYVYSAEGEDRSTYVISFCLGHYVGGLNPGKYIATPSGIFPTNFFVCGDFLSDVDSNSYATVKLGDQCWMQENLKTTKYKNGVSISKLTDNTAWANDSSGAYSCYNNNDGNCSSYGALYNGYAVKNSNGLCPEGWRVASNMDYYYLLAGYYGALFYALPGEPGQWDIEHVIVFDVIQRELEFNANPNNGLRTSSGGFSSNALYFTASSYNQNNMLVQNITLNTVEVEEASSNSGGYVRCIKN